MLHGNYSITAVAEPVPREIDLKDNTFVDGIVELLGFHDVAIINVTPSTHITYQGQIVNITVVAVNLGNFTETFNITAYYDSTIIETKTVHNLAPNEEITLTFRWNTTHVAPCHNYTISAIASGIPNDTNTTNNIFTDGDVKIKMMGDITGDGKVDIRDVSIVASAFGETPERPRWNPLADINKDGKIDIRDVALVSGNFGKCA
jgi:hypothetical protein